MAQWWQVYEAHSVTGRAELVQQVYKTCIGIIRDVLFWLNKGRIRYCYGGIKVGLHTSTCWKV
jgi:hypothetical protein